MLKFVSLSEYHMYALFIYGNPTVDSYLLGLLLHLFVFLYHYIILFGSSVLVGSSINVGEKKTLFFPPAVACNNEEAPTVCCAM
jgi:hypothetical protein